MCRAYAYAPTYLDPCALNGLISSFPTIGRGAGINKAIVDYTSPALCTPVMIGVAGKGVNPFPAEVICSERGSDGMIYSAARRYWRSSDLFAAIVLQWIVSREENPQNCQFPLGFRHPAGGGPIHDHRQHAQEIW